MDKITCTAFFSCFAIASSFYQFNNKGSTCFETLCCWTYHEPLHVSSSDIDSTTSAFSREDNPGLVSSHVFPI